MRPVASSGRAEDAPEGDYVLYFQPEMLGSASFEGMKYRTTDSD